MMKNCNIAYYISSHGFGHLTRSLALIEYLLENTDCKIYLCSGEAQIEFAQIYLNRFSDKVRYSVFKTDVGIVNKKNSLEVDVDATNKAVYGMLDTYSEKASTEAKKLVDLKIELIISDVSAFACLVAELADINLVEIGNFTWTDQYISVGADPKIIETFKEIYSTCANFIAYDLSLEFAGAPQNSVFKSDYLTSRPIKAERVKEIRQKYSKLYKEKTGSQNCDMLYLSLGKSAELPQVNLKNFNGVVFYTQGIEFNQSEYPNIIFEKLPNEICDSQSFIAAADLVIAKAGWSTSAEGVVAHSKMLLIERPGVDDDMNTINSLKKRQLVSSLTTEEVVDLDYTMLLERAKSDINTDKLNKVSNDTDKMCKKLMSYIK
jgi:hypothetical protein